MILLGDLTKRPRHVVAVIGGAVSGSEAAAVCAERGVIALVIERGKKPYGKIEDGLPRWHDKLRSKEYARIDENLTREGVFFVPQTTLGVDVALDALLHQWGVSTVLLSSGAGRDRPLALPGADGCIDRGLVYQNPFVHWFNHYEEPGFNGPRYEVMNDAIVVGGGLASVDVAKIIQLELYRGALRKHGIDVGVVELEHTGITHFIESKGLDANALGVGDVRLYYRRRVCDMPLAFPKDDSPEALVKVGTVREKMVEILKEKFRIRMEPCHMPVAALVEGSHMVGLRMRRTEMKDGKLVEIAGSDYDVRSPLTVSSIGSVPEHVPGIPLRGELYDFTDWERGTLRDLPGVFGLGNVLTGKGNIKDSRHNAKVVSDAVMESYLGIGRAPGSVDESTLVAPAHQHAREQAAMAVDRALRGPALLPEQLAVVVQAVGARWRAVGYDGDYARYIAQQRG